MEDGLKGLFGLLDSGAAELDEVKPRELTDKMIQNIAGKQFGKRVYKQGTFRYKKPYYKKPYQKLVGAGWSTLARR